MTSRVRRAARATPGAMLLMSMMIVPGCSALKTPFGSVEHQLDVGRVGHHRDDARRLTGDVRRRCGARRAGRDELVDRALAAAVDDERDSRP